MLRIVSREVEAIRLHNETRRARLCRGAHRSREDEREEESVSRDATQMLFRNSHGRVGETTQRSALS